MKQKLFIKQERKQLAKYLALSQISKQLITEDDA